MRVYAGADGDFTWYEDEGDTYNYEKGLYATVPFHWDNSSHTLTIGERNGKFPGMHSSQTFHIVLVSKNHGAGVEPTANPEKIIIFAGSAMSTKL